MPKTNESALLLTLLMCGYLLTGCPTGDDELSAPAAPEPIGAELLHWATVWGLPACSRGYLYREGRALQYQCFTLEGAFSWENRGLLSPAGAEALDAELAAADIDNTEPGNYMGLCNSSDATAATFTLWVGDRSISYVPDCPTKGIESLNELMHTLLRDIGDCVEFDLLESVEPGCRPY